MVQNGPPFCKLFVSFAKENCGKNGKFLQRFLIYFSKWLQQKVTTLHSLAV
jgi:hypothetical protein